MPTRKLFLCFLLPLSSCHAFFSGVTCTKSCLAKQRPTSFAAIATTTTTRTAPPQHTLRGQHHRRTPTRLRLNPSPDTLEQLRQANLKAHNEVWESRRNMARATLSAAQAWRHAREKVSGPPDAQQNGSIVADSKGALAASAAVVAVAAATLRLGGRAALVSALGLDFADDIGVKDNLESFVAFFDGLGPIRYGYFLGGWVVAKTFCLDFLSIVLALGSGIVFGGVLQGALVSTACATIASGLGFQLARTKLRSQVEEQLEKRPALRALEKVVSEEGFKTVVTLRLAPVLPIPLGAYNYVYGATSLPLPTFLAGMFVGSLKPYLLDSYLGVFGKSIVDGDAGSNGDLALVGTFFVVVLVGTFASQVAGRTWEELNAEAQKSTEATATSPSDSNLSESSTNSNSTDGLEWLDLWGIERSSLPSWLTSWQAKEEVVRNKMRSVVKQEWVYMSDRNAAMDKEEGQLIPKESRLPPPGGPVLDESGRFFDVGAYVTESTVFPFILMESFWKYSDAMLAVEEAEVGEDDYGLGARDQGDVEGRDRTNGR